MSGDGMAAPQTAHGTPDCFSDSAFRSIPFHAFPLYCLCILSVFQVTSPAISGTGNVSNNRSTSCADPSELHLTAPAQRRKKQKNIHLQSFQQTSIMETAEHFLLDPYNRHIPVSPRSGCSEVKSILLFTARTSGTGLHMFRSDLTHQTTTTCAARFQQLRADAFSARAAPVH